MSFAAPGASEVTHRRLDVQGLRAIAVLMVLAFHADLPMRGGYTGVDVFFVISGFVITGVLRREYESTGTLRFGTFYARRVRRLGPALALLVAVVLILSFFLQGPLGAQQTTAATGIGALLTAANAVAYDNGGYFAEASETNPLLHTWTLSVEEQFYFVFPVLLFLLFRLRKGNYSLLSHVAFGAAIFGSFTLAVALQRGVLTIGNPELLAFYASPTRAWEFGCGAALGLWLSLRPTSGEHGSQVTSTIGVGAGLLLIAFSGFALDGTSEVPGIDTIPAIAGTMLVIGAGSRPNRLSNALSTPPMLWVGDRSYGIYLWHWPLVVFAGLLWPNRTWLLVAATIVSLVPAALSFRFVEQPLQKRRDGRLGRAPRLAAACILPPLVLGGILWAGAERTWGDTELEEIAARRGAWEDPPQGCDFDATTTVFECDRVMSGSDLDIYLVGDSHAMALSPAVVSAADALGAGLKVRAIGGCAFAIFTGEGPRPTEECPAWVDGVLKDLEADRPDLIVFHQCER